MIDEFHGVPVIRAEDPKAHPYITLIESPLFDMPALKKSIEANKLVLFRDIPFDRATEIFQQLVDDYGIRDSYNIQMQYVVHTISDRAPVDDLAVTVNARDPYQLIQPHAEGDSSSPLDLFGLFCFKNSASGGHNVLSLINQSADHSTLCAKEKVIIGSDLSAEEVAAIRGEHFDAKRILREPGRPLRVLSKNDRGCVAVVASPATPSTSRLNGQNLVTYWDNVTVHDHAFHQHHYELLKALDLLDTALGSDYREYAHVESDSSWGPMDTNSGNLPTTALRYSCHLIHKLEPGDFLVFHNRAWTHSANNWPPEQPRNLVAMYA